MEYVSVIQRMLLETEMCGSCSTHSTILCRYFVALLDAVVNLEAFTAVSMKNGVFWDVTPCGSCIFAASVGCYLQLAFFLVHRFLSP
jgi:hypothetical protein